MSDLDKDIEECKFLKDSWELSLDDDEKQAIENVLLELETKIGQTHLLSEEVFCLNKELEIKDKMIDKMAYRIVELVEKVYGNTHEQKYVIECFRRSI